MRIPVDARGPAGRMREERSESLQVDTKHFGHALCQVCAVQSDGRSRCNHNTVHHRDHVRVGSPFCYVNGRHEVHVAH